MTYKLAIANQKGGVGKTSLCLQAVHYLVEVMKIEPSRILAIDFDPQGNFSSRLAHRFTDDTGSDTNDFGDGTATYELYSKDLIQIKPSVCPNGVHLIHSKRNDTRITEASTRQAFDVVVEPRTQLNQIADQYDYFILDCPPGLAESLVSALIIATHVVTPVEVSGFAVDGVVGVMNTIADLQDGLNPDLISLGIVINKMDKSVSHEKAYKALKQVLGDFVFSSVLRYRSPVDTATSEGTPVWSLSYAHVAAAEVKALMKELFTKVSA